MILEKTHLLFFVQADWLPLADPAMRPLKTSYSLDFGVWIYSTFAFMILPKLGINAFWRASSFWERTHECIHAILLSFVQL